MDFLELAKSRFSVRKFKQVPVEQEYIDKILEAGAVSPTACNLQPEKILVVNSESGLKNLRKSTECHFNAPLAFIISYDKEQCWKRSYDGKISGDIDASIVGTHMMLEAAQLGIGSTWVMYFIPEAVRVEFKLPDNLEPVAILVMGYPADGVKPEPGHKEKKELKEIVNYNTY